MTSPAITQLQSDVSAEGTVIDSAVTLLNGLGAQIAAVAGDQAATMQLSQDVTSKAQALAQAVSDNTPAAKA